MDRLRHTTKIIIFDTLGVLFMIGAILTGWLPGPGGIPLFILGLSLLAVNHAWAKRYMKNFENTINQLSKKVFNNNSKVQLAYDLVCPLFVAAGIYLLWQHAAAWLISVGIFLSVSGLVLFIGNRQRWPRLKKYFKKI